MEDFYTLIIPDVHGRTFWRQPVKEALDDNYCEDIVFLGDYVDPYPHEGISNMDAISVLQEIIKLKTQHSNRIHLLLGNHDLGYIYDDINECRRDWEHYDFIRKMFMQNSECFDLAWETTVKNQRFLFTHAGIIDGWMRRHPELFEGDIVCIKRLNELLHRDENDPDHQMLMDALADASWVRGGLYWNGSMVWADEFEFIQEGNSLDNMIQVFGHSWQNDSPLCISKPGKCNAYCLDCREAFILDGHGLIRHYKEDGLVE